MKVSIIIPTLNRYQQLQVTLQSLLTLEKSKDAFEIIIIDNGSTDKTSHIVKKFQDEFKDFNIRYFYDAVPGLLTGRHRGALEAKGEVLTFIDDDIFVSDKWLTTIIDVMMMENEIKFLTGPNFPLYDSYPPEWIKYFWEKADGGNYCIWLSLMDLGAEVKEIHPNFVWGLNFTIRKDTFYELGGFHPDNIASEYQMFQGDGETGLTQKGFEKGYKALYHPGVLIYHQIDSSRLTLEYFDKRAYYEGVCNSFTQIRTNEAIMTTNNKVAKSGQIRIFSKIISRLESLFKTAQPKKSKNPNIIPQEIIELKERFSLQAKKGYKFHQHQYQTNPLVSEWCHKENYYNYNIPI